MEFTPNWKRLGFEDQVASWKHVISCLAREKKKITSHSLSNEAIFTLGGQMFVIKGKKKEEKD